VCSSIVAYMHVIEVSRCVVEEFSNHRKLESGDPNP
jgi:hypothetical protein